MDSEYGLGQRLVDFFEALIEEVLKLHGLESKTPPHDIAASIVAELKRRR